MHKVWKKAGLGLAVLAVALATALSVNWTPAPAQASVNWQHGEQHSGSVNWNQEAESVNWT